MGVNVAAARRGGGWEWVSPAGKAPPAHNLAPHRDFPLPPLLSFFCFCFHVLGCSNLSPSPGRWAEISRALGWTTRSHAPFRACAVPSAWFQSVTSAGTGWGWEAVPGCLRIGNKAAKWGETTYTVPKGVIHSFNKYLQSTYFVPGSEPGLLLTINKTKTVPALMDIRQQMWILTWITPSLIWWSLPYHSQLTCVRPLQEFLKTLF